MTFRSVVEARSVLSAVEASWSETENAYLPLMQKNGPLTSAKLVDVQAKLRARSASSTIQIGDDVLSGLVRNALGSTRANLFLAKEILAGPAPERHLSTIFSLVDTAKLGLRPLRTLATSVRTVSEYTSAGGTSSSLVRISGFGDLGFAPPLWVAGLALAVGLVIFVVGVAVLVDTMQRSQNAEIALRVAREACDRAARSGAPCTPEQFQAAYEEAARVQNEISPPILGGGEPGEGIADKLGDLIFWGGILAIGSVVAYGVFATLPAVMGFRKTSGEAFSGPPDINSKLMSARSLRRGDWVNTEDGWKTVLRTSVGDGDATIVYDDGTSYEGWEEEIFLVRRLVH